MRVYKEYMQNKNLTLLFIIWHKRGTFLIPVEIIISNLSWVGVQNGKFSNSTIKDFVQCFHDYMIFTVLRDKSLVKKEYDLCFYLKYYQKMSLPRTCLVVQRLKIISHTIK